MQAKAMNAKRDLTTGALLPKIILFTLPLIATGILQLLFNTADTIVVGRWGGETKEAREAALAAVGSCGALINLIINMFFGLSVGAGVCVAQELGARQYHEVKKTVHTSVLVAVLCGAVVSVIGFILARPLLTLMGTEPAVLDEAVPYMRAYFIGAPANTVYNYCAAILRSSGDTTHPLVFLSVAGVVNVGLNLVMVTVFSLGALGVGIATAVAQWISCILILRHMMCLQDHCHLSLRELKIDRAKLKKVVAIGIPAGLQGMVFSISNVLIQSSVNSFGQTTVAAKTAASSLTDYIYIAQNSLYHAALTFVGQNAGARDYRRVRHSIFCCMGTVTVLGLVLGGLVILFGEPLLSIYAPGNESVVHIGMIPVRILSSTYFLCGLMDVGSGVLRGLGKSVRAMIISLVGSCVTRIIWIYTVFAADHTLEVLYACYPLSWALTATTYFTMAFIFLHRLEVQRKSSDLAVDVNINPTVSQEVTE